MTLDYNPKFKDYSTGWTRYFCGLFIDPRTSDVSITNANAVDHDQDLIIRTFKEFFNPTPIDAPASKEETISILNRRIQYIKSLKKIDTTQYISLKLYNYFLKAYQSSLTKMWNNGIDVVELDDTTGYHPIFEYAYWGNDYSLDEYKSRFLSNEDKYSILKSILIQACDIDSLEGSVPNTIYTSKNNIYETFYNYYLMDFDIVTIPKKVFDQTSQRFIDYEQNSFFVSDKEIRLKEEIKSIKRLVPLEDRPKYFRLIIK